MSNIIWSNVAPSGRSYSLHVKGLEKDGRGEDSRNNKLTFHQAVLACGGGPVRTHSALTSLFDLIDAGYSIDDSLAEGTAVIGAERSTLRVTGLYAS